MGKFYKFYSLIFLFLISACAFQRIPEDAWRQMEIEDDNICMAAGIGYESPKTRTTYWDCRIRVLEQRIDDYDSHGIGLLTKGDLRRIRRAMVKRKKREAARIKLDIELADDEKDHNYCVLLGQRMIKVGQSFDYFQCRDEVLAKKKKMGEVPSSYLTNDQIFDSLESNVEDSKINIIQDVDKKCVKFISNEIKYKNCISESHKINTCTSSIGKQLVNRNLNDEMYCMNRTLERFPDSLALFNSDSSVVTFGPKIDKFDLIELRDKEYNDCKLERKKKLAEYSLYLQSECEKLTDKK